jgi:glucokinase
MVMERAILGIDIGGTKTAAGIVAADGRALSYVREATPQGADAQRLLEFVAGVARRACAAAGVAPAAVGVGCGGPMRYPEGVVSPLHIPVWRDFPLRDALAGAFGLPTIVDNDAKALALGEALFGAGRGSRAMVGMVVSTGVGGGIVVGGRLLHGATGNAGHIGHAIVVPGGLSCECGARGCLTPYASGTGIAARAREAIRRGVPTSLAALPPDQLTAEMIAAHAAGGDRLARRLFGDAGRMLARAIAGAAAVLDVDRFVLGGGVTRSGALLFGPLRRELRLRARLSFTAGMDVVPAQLGLESGVVGAAALAREIIG